MKNIISLIICLFAFVVTSVAQEVQGKILLNERSENRIELKVSEPVGLYAQLREKAVAINFVFEGKGLSRTSSGQEVALIWFRTTVKHNGKEIGVGKRDPMPFFPGDMWMPVETFDIISILAGGKANAKLSPGKYEVVLEAMPTGAKGEIKPASLFFEVR